MAMTLELSHQPMHPIFTPWCAGDSRHERLVRKHVPDSDPACALLSTSMPALHGRNVPNCRRMADGGMRKCSAVEDFARRGACPPQGSGWGKTAIQKAKARRFTIFILLCGLRKAMVIPEKACPVPRYGGRNPEGWGGGKTAASLTLVNSDYPLRHPGESAGQNPSVAYQTW